MATKDEEVFDAFVRKWSTWWSGVPDRLARQESSLVVRLLTLGLRRGGISQADVRRELQINQPRLSKLADKLHKAGWIKVKTSTGDRRIRLIATTVKAQEKLATLRKDLAALLRAQGAGQAPAPVPQSKPAPVRSGKVTKEQPGQPPARVRTPKRARFRRPKPFPQEEGRFYDRLVATDTES
jgi:DNA-binding MarR family transcriptional regulator